MKYNFIAMQQSGFPVTALCRVMQVSTSAYYGRCGRGGEIIDSETWQLCHWMKALFVIRIVAAGTRVTRTGNYWSSMEWAAR